MDHIAARQRLSTMLEQARGAHENFYKDEAYDYELMPMYFLSQGEEKTILVAIGDMPPEAKDAVVAMVRGMADKEQCDGYVYNSEGWTIPPEAMPLHVPGESFSKRPDRIEILLLEAGLRSGGHAMQKAVIHRTPGSSPRLEWDPPIFEGDEAGRITSRFNLWDPQVPKVEKFPSQARH